MNYALYLHNINKSFGNTKAVENLDLVVPQGALYGLIGPNGAGKTTTIRMIMAILFPDTGELSVLGRRNASDAKDRVGYLPEERGVYRKMRVNAFLRYMVQLKGIAAAEAARRVEAYLERVGLGDSARKKCEELSKGMLQKVQFGAAILHRPDLLILDEPFSGLDPVSVRIMREIVIEEHRRGATIMLSTHAMAHAEELCQHVVMIHRGHKVLDESVAQIRRRYVPRSVIFEPLELNADISALRTLSEVEHIELSDGTYKILLREHSDARTAMPRLAAAVPPARIELSRLKLEDIFVQIVGEDQLHQSGDDQSTVRAQEAVA